MPTLKQYVNTTGHYVVSAVGGHPVTFQLSAEGESFLTEELSLAHQSSFAIKELVKLVEQGWAYTNKTGPGNRMARELMLEQLLFGKSKSVKLGSAEPVRLEGAANHPQSEVLEIAHAARLERMITLRLESTDIGALDGTVLRIVQHLAESKTKILGPLPLPTRVEHYNVGLGGQLRRFSVYTHKRILSIIMNDKTDMQKTTAVPIPAGLHVKATEHFQTISVVKGR